MERFANGYFRAHGRVDDSMNLNGIKVSSLQIDRTPVEKGSKGDEIGILVKARVRINDKVYKLKP